MQPQNYHPRRLFDSSMLVSKTGFFRVHVAPKRFPQALEIDWQSRIIADNEDFVVVSKPWGVQVTHRYCTSNVQQNITLFVRTCCCQAIEQQSSCIFAQQYFCVYDGAYAFSVLRFPSRLPCLWHCLETHEMLGLREPTLKSRLPCIVI